MSCFTIEDNRIVWERAGEIMWIEGFGRNAIRVRASKNMRIKTEEWGALLQQAPAKVKISRETIKNAPVQLDPITWSFADCEQVVLQNGNSIATIREDGYLTFFNTKKEKKLEEYYRDRRVSINLIRPARCYQSISSETFETDVYFKADAEEHFYGMGQYLNNCLDLKGTTLELAQKNTQCSVPFLLSSKGYGFIWNNPSIGRVEFVKNHTLWHSDGTAQIDYVFFAGEKPADIVEYYTELTGRAPEMPSWALGLWQSKLRYVTQAELLEVAREYKKRGIPLSVIVSDYFHWTQQGDWKFDPIKWPDPQTMCDELKKMGVELMVSIWPTVDMASENYTEMYNKGFLMRTEQGFNAVMQFLGPQIYYDATHPGARTYIWEKAKKNYSAYGIKLFWLDEAEPEMRPYSYSNVRYYLGNGREVSNLYPLMHAKGFYEGMANSGEKEICNLIRCCWLGSQRYGVIMWSGDCPSDFPTLESNIKAALNIGLAGIPWWTSDIGGFFDGCADNPHFCELLIRWYQFGIFSPIFRMHGFRKPEIPVPGSRSTGSPNEIWSYGEENYAIMKKWLLIREKLRPYIAKQMEVAQKKGTPVIRPLFYDFPEQPDLWKIEDQYMFGPDILVAPITAEGVRERNVILPAGSKWKNAYTGDFFEGGQTLLVNAPLEQIPLFFRADSKVNFVW